MSHWTRRKFLKTGLAATAGAAAAKAALPLSAAPRSQAAANATSTELRPFTPRNAETPVAANDLSSRQLLDFGWRFHFGHANDPAKDFGFGAQNREATFAKSGAFPPVTRANFDDSQWRVVDIPHDWAVELPFEKGRPVLDREGKPTDRFDLPDQGAKPIGRDFPETSIGWYRRVFDISAMDAGQRISVEFDGVFRHAMVMFNGHYFGEEFSGYAPFRFDLTDFVTFGDKNVLTVRVDATLAEGWFYEGAGIYRHVWLTKTQPLHIAPDGIFVTSQVHGDSVTVSIRVEVQNESDTTRTCGPLLHVLEGSLKDATTEHKNVANIPRIDAVVPAWGSHTFESQVTFNNPLPWSVDEPHLYHVIVVLQTESVASDFRGVDFGIRTAHFDPNKGFFLNEKSVKLKGTCNHQDHAGVGSALPDRLQYYRVERLKSMGCNAYRTSHNPPTPELLDACDRLGMLVMCETRMMSSNPEGLSQLERMIRKYRNHPSIIIWSLGNEEREQGTPRGVKIISSMKRLAKELDPSRPVTLAMNGSWGKGASAVVDVQGFNYFVGNIDDFHKQFPNQPTTGSETASTVCTRGIYENDKERGYVNAYDKDAPPWATTAEKWWKYFDERPFLSGGFAWTGFDYRGEPTPYNWPCISSHFGIMDTCGFPKDNYFYYQAWWGAQPVLHLFPHWNWPGKEGQEIDVWCHSNLDGVELFLNGASLGSQKVERNTHLAWKVKYVPGTIEARGTKNGKIVLADKRETTGAPAKLALRPDRQKISADGEDLSVIAVEVHDAQGRIVPIASNEVSFEVTGAGKIIGVGNGDPSCHEPDKATKRSAFNGLCMAFMQATKQAGEIRVVASAAGLESASTVIQAEAAQLRPAVD
jgi:beta-galactosidase